MLCEGLGVFPLAQFTHLLRRKSQIFVKLNGRPPGRVGRPNCCRHPNFFNKFLAIDAILSDDKGAKGGFKDLKTKLPSGKEEV